MALGVFEAGIKKTGSGFRGYFSIGHFGVVVVPLKKWRYWPF